MPQKKGEPQLMTQVRFRNRKTTPEKYLCNHELDRISLCCLILHRTERVARQIVNGGVYHKGRGDASPVVKKRVKETRKNAGYLNSEALLCYK
jgi:hypothetical protein